MSDIGLAGGAAPSTPGHRYGASPRRFGPAVDVTIAGWLAGWSMAAGRFARTGRLGERCPRPTIVKPAGEAGCHDGGRRVKPLSRFLRFAPAVPVTHRPPSRTKQLWTNAGVRPMNGTGIDRFGPTLAEPARSHARLSFGLGTPGQEPAGHGRHPSSRLSMVSRKDGV